MNNYYIFSAWFFVFDINNSDRVRGVAISELLYFDHIMILTLWLLSCYIKLLEAEIVY